jgi:hypothetical protein
MFEVFKNGQMNEPSHGIMTGLSVALIFASCQRSQLLSLQRCPALQIQRIRMVFKSAVYMFGTEEEWLTGRYDREGADSCQEYSAGRKAEDTIRKE